MSSVCYFVQCLSLIQPTPIKRCKITGTLSFIVQFSLKGFSLYSGCRELSCFFVFCFLLFWQGVVAVRRAARSRVEQPDRVTSNS